MSKKIVPALLHEFVRNYREDNHYLATKETMVSNFKYINKVSDVFINYWFDVQGRYEIDHQELYDLIEYMYDNPKGYVIDYRIGKAEENAKN